MLKNYQGTSLTEIVKELVKANIDFKIFINDLTEAVHFLIENRDGYIDVTSYSTIGNAGKMVHFGLDIEFMKDDTFEYYQGSDIKEAMKLIKKRLGRSGE